MPIFLAMLVTSGLRHPVVSAAAGAAWVVGRVIYSYGYYTCNPKHRMPGVKVK